MADPSPDYDAISERIREELADQADLHAGGDVNAPNVVAHQALGLYDKYRYNRHFQLIVELAYADGHARGQKAVKSAKDDAKKDKAKK